MSDDPIEAWLKKKMSLYGWQRDGYFYVSKTRISNWCVRTRKLGFFSYWLIKLIHGESKLKEME